jgi:AcrR family transcriptional regulator
MSDISASPENKREQTLAKRRRLILDAALDCFVENGFHQTGVRDIAKRAGVSLGNVYNHFPGKHDVLVEIAALEKSELEPYLKEIGPTEPNRDGLEQIIKGYFDYVSEPSAAVLALEITSEAFRKPDIAALFVRNRRMLLDALSDYLDRGAKAGCFRTVSSPKADAQLLVDLIEGAGYRSVLENEIAGDVIGEVTRFAFAALVVEKH